MAEATLDDVIHRLKLNNRNTNRALRMNAKEQAEAFGTVMGVTVTSLAGAFDASISRLVTTSALTVNSEVGLVAADRMNETLYEIRDISQEGFDKLFNALAGDSLDEAERRRRQSFAGRDASTITAGAPEQRSGGGGLLARLASGLGLGAGLGFGLGGIGLGLGAAAAGTGIGVGIGAAGIAGLLFAVNELDGAAVRENIGQILAIKEDVDGVGDVAIVGATLFALGTGLAVFGAGSTIAGLSDALTNFTNSNFATSIKDNITTLLSITEGLTIGNISAVTGALVALGGGLAVFGIGSTVAGLADALTNFTNVGWADSIRDNVESLLSISEFPLTDTGRFIATMTGLSAGLVAFAVGGVASQAATLFGMRGFATPIVDNVRELLEVAELGDEGKSAEFLNTMKNLSAGIALFSAANAFDALAGVGTRILNFFSGNQSPIKAITSLTDNVEDLQQVSTGLESISDALNKFSEIKFNVRDADFQGLIKNIQKAVPLVESLATGQSKLFGRDIPSLLDPSLRLDELVVAMDQLNAISSGASQLSDIDVRTVSVNADQMKMLQSQVNDNAASPTVVVAPSTQNNSTVNQSNTVMNEVSMAPFATMSADRYVSGGGF